VVVFCPGVTLSSRVWAKQFASFPAAGFRAVAFDSRGHGESRAGDTGHSLDNLADDLRTVLEALDLRDVVLVGHSMGGMAVQAFAVRHTDVVDERVAGLVLLSTSSHNLVSDAKRVRGAIERVVNFGPDVATFMRQRNLGLLLANIGFGDDPHPSHVEATREMLAACGKATTREAVSALLHLDLTEGLPKVEAPTLVVVGTADALTPPRDGRRIAELVPGARLVEYEGGGHMLMYERTEELDALIMDFAFVVQARDVQAGDGAIAAADATVG
jgi:pimeloyl-ACP methyl ester carboxylesterase